MESSNSEDLQQTEHRELCLSHLNYVDGISADNNAEFEFQELGVIKACNVEHERYRTVTLAWCLSELEPMFNLIKVISDNTKQL